MKDLIGTLPSAVLNMILKLTFILNFLVILKSVAKPVKNVKSLFLFSVRVENEYPHGAAIMNRSGVIVFLPTVMGYMAKLITEGDKVIDPPWANAVLALILYPVISLSIG